MVGPTKLTQEVHDFTCEQLKKGNYVDVVMQSQGISRRNYYYWMQRGADEAKEGEESIYTRFAYDVAIAHATAQIDIINAIRGLGDMSADEKIRFAALTWLAERKFGRWNKANKQVSVDLTKEELGEIDEDQLKHLMGQVFGETPKGESNE